MLKIFIKHGLAIMLTAISAFSYAASVESKTDYFSGLYTGAGIFFQNNTESYEGPLVQRLTDASIKNIRGGDNSWGGSLSLGYGKLYQQSYFGAELYANANAGRQDLITGFKVNRFLSMQAPYTYGITSKIGHLLNQNTLIYLGLGLENTRFKFITNRNGTDVITLADSFQWGLVPAAGIDYAINSHWQVGTRFSYVNYGVIQFGSDADYNNSGSFNSRHALIAAKVIYRF